MRIAIFVVAAAAPLLMAPGALPAGVAPRAGLCAAGEPVLFACAAGARQIAVCGSPPQYRYGTPGKVELAYPAAGDTGGISVARTSYSGGGETQLVFQKGAFQYVVYSSMIRTGFGPGGNNPKFEAGVAVLKNGTTVSTRKCTAPADASIDLDRAPEMPSADFVDH